MAEKRQSSSRRLKISDSSKRSSSGSSSSKRNSSSINSVTSSSKSTRSTKSTKNSSSTKYRSHDRKSSSSHKRVSSSSSKKSSSRKTPSSRNLNSNNSIRSERSSRNLNSNNSIRSERSSRNLNSNNSIRSERSSRSRAIGSREGNSIERLRFEMLKMKLDENAKKTRDLLKEIEIQKTMTLIKLKNRNKKEEDPQETVKSILYEKIMTMQKKNASAARKNKQIQLSALKLKTGNLLVKGDYGFDGGEGTSSSSSSQLSPAQKLFCEEREKKLLSTREKINRSLAQYNASIEVARTNCENGLRYYLCECKRKRLFQLCIDKIIDLSRTMLKKRSYEKLIKDVLVFKSNCEKETREAPEFHMGAGVFLSIEDEVEIRQRNAAARIIQLYCLGEKEIRFKHMECELEEGDDDNYELGEEEQKSLSPRPSDLLSNQSGTQNYIDMSTLIDCSDDEEIDDYDENDCDASDNSSRASCHNNISDEEKSMFSITTRSFDDDDDDRSISSDRSNDSLSSAELIPENLKTTGRGAKYLGFTNNESHNESHNESLDAPSQHSISSFADKLNVKFLKRPTKQDDANKNVKYLKSVPKGGGGNQLFVDRVPLAKKNHNGILGQFGRLNCGFNKSNLFKTDDYDEMDTDATSVMTPAPTI